jgi:murein DD-endopeptidase MepM/ murein hydrolase activator NlpD
MNGMNRVPYFSFLFALTGLIIAMPGEARSIVSSADQPSPLAIAPQSVKQDPPTGLACPDAALSRLTRHRIEPGETLVTIAQRYNLIPATLMGMNPSLRTGEARAGTEILIPPYNGIQVEAPRGSTWRDLAAAYGVRADVLFEINGCQDVPRTVFIPGVNWSPNPAAATVATEDNAASGYPLPETAAVLTGYGWQLDNATGTVVFHSGVDLSAERGTPVLAAGDGLVAFVGQQGTYGNLVVINHADGLQTRYAQLDATNVEMGQQVRRGDRIGSVGATGLATVPHLHFEVRSNSDLGWVAQNPGNYVRNMRFGN